MVVFENPLKELFDGHEDDVWSAAAGVAAFWSTLAVSTWSQQRLGISTASAPPLPTALGFASVCLASWASNQAAIAAQQCLRQGSINWPWDIREKRQRSATNWWTREEPVIDLRFIQIPKHTVRICCLGLLTFKLLGGRFWGVAPSSYTHVGSFARVIGGSIPATHKYATAAERLRMERLGRVIGCHTCGSHKLFTREAFRFVGDHQPPKAIAEQLNGRLHRRLLGWKVSYRFFPQCRDCSSIQGGILSKATTDLRAAATTRSFLRSSEFFAQVKGAQSYFHGWRPRIYHWTGAVLGCMAVVGASDKDLEQGGNQSRYKELERQLSDFNKSLQQKLRNKFG